MSIDDLSDVIAQEAVPLTITRTAAPSMSLGRPSPGSPSTVSITASVQPLPTKELMLVPEGMRNRGVCKLFTKTELLTLPMPDRFTYKGELWEIVEVKNWLDLGNYYRCLAARVTFT